MIIFHEFEEGFPKLYRKHDIGKKHIFTSCFNNVVNSNKIMMMMEVLSGPVLRKWLHPKLQQLSHCCQVHRNLCCRVITITNIWNIFEKHCLQHFTKWWSSQTEIGQQVALLASCLRSNQNMTDGSNTILKNQDPKTLSFFRISATEQCS